MDLTAKEVLDVFADISRIPRCSKNEEKIASWLKEWAVSNGFNIKFDSVNNILITVPASEGYEEAPVVVIQGHMDMVCEKNVGVEHDFSKYPIKLVFDGDWLKAEGTTLGADNGVGMALALAMAKSKDVPHPKLELLFTVDEETGLTGANELAPDFISGTIMLNLDSEDDGVFIIGCAGGVNTNIRFPLEYEPVPANCNIYALTVDGLAGGHSGVDIHEHRANANKVLVNALDELMTRFELRIVSIKGGSAHNAIPRNAEAVVAMSPADYGEARSLVQEMESAIIAEYSDMESSVSIRLSGADETIAGEALKQELAIRIIDLLVKLPHGVAGMSAGVPGLVETSNNLATVGIRDDELVIVSSQRSSVVQQLDNLSSRIESLAVSAGAGVSHDSGYPAWQPDSSSPLLERCRRVYGETFDKEPDIQIIHAGLECAVIGSKFPEMDMISFGPTIRNPHSPDEKLYIPSVANTWKFLLALLASFGPECE